MSIASLARRLEEGCKSPNYQLLMERTRILNQLQCATMALICDRSENYDTEKLRKFTRLVEDVQKLMPEGDTFRSAQVMTILARKAGL